MEEEIEPKLSTIGLSVCQMVAVQLYGEKNVANNGNSAYLAMIFKKEDKENFLRYTY